MQRSVVKDVEMKVLLKQALTDRVNDRALFTKGIDVSYYYEGYSECKTGELQISGKVAAGARFFRCGDEAGAAAGSHVSCLCACILSRSDLPQQRRDTLV